MRFERLTRAAVKRFVTSWLEICERRAIREKKSIVLVVVFRPSKSKRRKTCDGLVTARDVDDLQEGELDGIALRGARGES
jgi:hypothetical protein